MKKYITAIAAFLLVAGMANAQTAKKPATTSPTVKTTPASSTKKASTNTASVTPAKSSTDNKTSTTATVRKKHHKKTKSVPAKQ